MNTYSFKALKGGIREYISILIAIYTIYDELSVIDDLNHLYNKLDNTNSIDDLNDIKDSIIRLQDEVIINTDKKIINDYSKLDRDLTDREISLIDRGYSKEDIINYSGYSLDTFKKISQVIINHISKSCNKVSNPICIFVGGQPGCGKSTNSLKLKEAFLENGAIEIGIDNFRPYHPNYLEIENIIKKHWEGRIQTDNDSPGNDFADFTHKFAGDMTDYLVDYFTNTHGDKYNLIIEWGMRTPVEPLKMMKILKDIGYKNIVNFVVVYKEESYNACILRADVMDGLEHVVRRIPRYFHDLCVKTLPDSCNTIYKDGFINNKYIDQFILISRDGAVIWDTSNKNEPGIIYNKYLNNK